MPRSPTTVRRDAVGDDVTYVVNRNINFTNVCYTGCRFCAFAQRRTRRRRLHAVAGRRSADRAEEAWAAGATEVCMQGGIDPDLPGTAYFDLVRAVKQRRARTCTCTRSRPMEVVNGAAADRAVDPGLADRGRARPGSTPIPGTAAEILDDDVRWVLTKGKLPPRPGSRSSRTAHERRACRSSSTMMYGHVDHPGHWLGAPAGAGRASRTETGGFTEFVPLPFVHHNAPIYLAGIARPGPTLRENRAVHAMARLLLHGRIANIQSLLGQARRRGHAGDAPAAAPTTSAAR